MTVTKMLELYTKKFQYHPPWTLSRWGLLTGLIGRGSDEWGNRSWFIIIPFIGQFIWFPGDVDRSQWFFSGSTDGKLSYISSDNLVEALISSPKIDVDLSDEYDLFDWVYDNQRTLTSRQILERMISCEWIEDT